MIFVFIAFSTTMAIITSFVGLDFRSTMINEWQFFMIISIVLGFIVVWNYGIQLQTYKTPDLFKSPSTLKRESITPNI